MRIITMIVNKLPMSCEQCDFLVSNSSGVKYCPIVCTHVNYINRPNACPLKEKEA